MTWAKFGVEFFDQCADAELSDAAVRTHVEAVHYLFRLEQMDMRLAKHLVRRFAGSSEWEQAAKDLVAAEFWRDTGDAYVVEHHGDVFRSSLAAQLKHRGVERDRQRRKRAKQSPAVGPNVGATQTFRLTDLQTAPTEADENGAIPVSGGSGSHPNPSRPSTPGEPDRPEPCPDCGHPTGSQGCWVNCGDRIAPSTETAP